VYVIAVQPYTYVISGNDDC